MHNFELFSIERTLRDSRRSPHGLGIRESFYQKVFTWRKRVQVLMDQQLKVPSLLPQALVWVLHFPSSLPELLPNLLPRMVENQIRSFYIYLSRYPGPFPLATFSHPHSSPILTLEGSNVTHEYSLHSLPHVFYSLSRCPTSYRFTFSFLILTLRFWSVTPRISCSHSFSIFSHVFLMSIIRCIMIIIPIFNLGFPLRFLRSLSHILTSEPFHS